MAVIVLISSQLRSIVAVSDFWLSDCSLTTWLFPALTDTEGPIPLGVGHQDVSDSASALIRATGSVLCSTGGAVVGLVAAGTGFDL